MALVRGGIRSRAVGITTIGMEWVPLCLGISSSLKPSRLEGGYPQRKFTRPTSDEVEGGGHAARFGTGRQHKSSQPGKPRIRE